MIEDMKEYQRQYHKNVRRRKVLEYVGKGVLKCVHCNSEDRLELDHIDPSKKSFSFPANIDFKDPVMIQELDKCQLLCHACHLEKTRRENRERGLAREVTHGSMYAWQKKKCTCEECGKAKKSYYEKRNAKRRSGNKRGPYNIESSHGERLNYSRGCRCDLCKAASAEYSRYLYHRRPDL